MADVVTIAVFPLEYVEEYRAKHGGSPPPAQLPLNALNEDRQRCGVARVGDSKPPNLGSGGRRLPRIPVQFVVIGYDGNDNEVPDIRNGRVLPNGNTVVLLWEAKMANRRYDAPDTPPWDKKFYDHYDTKRQQTDVIEDKIAAGQTSTKLSFQIDETGLLIPGNDGYFPHNFGAPTGTVSVDMTCDGDVTVTYKERTPSGTFDESKTKTAICRAVIGPPDWSANRDDLPVPPPDEECRQWQYPP